MNIVPWCVLFGVFFVLLASAKDGVAQEAVGDGAVACYVPKVVEDGREVACPRVRVFLFDVLGNLEQLYLEVGAVVGLVADVLPEHTDGLVDGLALVFVLLRVVLGGVLYLAQSLAYERHCTDCTPCR